MSKFKKILLSALPLLASCAGQRPTDLGVRQEEIMGQQTTTLKPCPDSPNCVTSFKRKVDDSHYLEPIKIISNKERAFQKIEGILGKTKGCEIVKKSEDYIYAEFTSDLLGFVDDVEFYFGDAGKVHFRSASRKGYSDLGVNKKRIERIRFKFHQNDF